MVYNLYTVKLERPKVVRYEHKYEGLYQMFCTLVRGVIMFMLSLMQPSGLYELEKDSLEAISAQLLQMIQKHQVRSIFITGMQIRQMK